MRHINKLKFYHYFYPFAVARHGKTSETSHNTSLRVKKGAQIGMRGDIKDARNGQIGKTESVPSEVLCDARPEKLADERDID